MKLTVICREEGYERYVLVYCVEVKNPADEGEVQAAVQVERSHDIEDPSEMEILFAFDGDLSPSQDWRD